MLRERRRHSNLKPNRRLDRKSSRGMIYENEELRLRTIHINAEVERGQNDIRKLRRENEQLKREIWNLRDEYDKLHQFLNNDHNSCENLGDRDFNSESCSEDSCHICREHNSPDDKRKENYHLKRNKVIHTDCYQKSSKNNYGTNNNSNTNDANPDNDLILKDKTTTTCCTTMSKNLQQKKNGNILNKTTSNLEKSKYQLDRKIKDDIDSTSQHISVENLSVVSEENLSKSDWSNNSIHESIKYYEQLTKQQLKFLQRKQLKQQQLKNIESELIVAQNRKISHSLESNNRIPGTTLPKLTPSLLQEKLISPPTPSSTVPPLSHFENICNEKYDVTADNNSLPGHCGQIANLYNEMKFANLQFNISNKSDIIIDNSNIDNYTNNNNNENDNNKHDNINKKNININNNLNKNNIENSSKIYNNINTNNNNSNNNNNNINNTNNNNNKNNNNNNNNSIINQIGSLSTRSVPKHFFSPIKTQISEIIAIQTKQPTQANFLFSNSLESSCATNESCETAVSKLQKIGPPDICVANVLGNYQSNIRRVNALASCDNEIFQKGGNLEELLLDIQNLTNNITVSSEINENKQSSTTFLQHKINENKHLENFKSVDIENQQSLVNNSIEHNSTKFKISPIFHRSEINLILNDKNKLKASNSVKDCKEESNERTLEKNLFTKQSSTTSKTSIFKYPTYELDINTAAEILPTPMELFPAQLPYLDFEVKLPSGNLHCEQNSSQQSKENNIFVSSKIKAESCVVTNSSEIESSYIQELPPLYENNETIHMDNKKPYLCNSICYVDKYFNLDISQSEGDLINVINNSKMSKTFRSSTDLQNSIAKIGNKREMKKAEIITNDCKEYSTVTYGSPSYSSSSYSKNHNHKHQYGEKILSPNHQSCSSRKLGYQSPRFNSGIYGYRKRLNDTISNNSCLKTSEPPLEEQIYLTSILSSHSLNSIKNCFRRHSDGTVIVKGNYSFENEPFLSNLAKSNNNCAELYRINDNKHSKTSINYRDQNHNDSVKGKISSSTIERNSNNSLVSSIESSTSINFLSRKMSIASHNAGKIPWCGCWGNGCL